MSKSLGFGLGLLVLLFLACNSEVEDPIDPAIYGHEYFPLQVGMERIYQVDSIQFDIGVRDLPVFDSSTYYIREEFVEVFRDQTDADVYRIERSRASSPVGPWNIVDVSTESRSTSQAMRTEGNIRFINLVFPVEEGVRWDGNAFIDEDRSVFVRGEAIEMFKNWEYEVLAEGEAETIGPHNYNEVALIQQAADTNAIEIRSSFEKYAKGVGLVWQERWILDSYCKYTGETSACFGLDWRSIAGRGFILRQTLVDRQSR